MSWPGGPEPVAETLSVVVVPVTGAGEADATAVMVGPGLLTVTAAEPPSVPPAGSGVVTVTAADPFSPLDGAV